MTKNYKFTARLFWMLFLSSCISYSGQLTAEEVIQIGIATPQAGEATDNIERLRKRAIRNAMEMAVMQVTGADITSVRGGLSSSRDTIVSNNGRVDERQKHTTTFHVGAKTKTTGNVKIVQVINEWQEGNRYFVKVKLNVANEKELLKSTSVGTLWERIDKPAIDINVSLTRNNRQGLTGKALQNYLEDNLSRNDIDVNVIKTGAERFSIQVTQTFKNAVVPEMGTYKTSCELSFAIVDNDTNRSLADYRITHGPDGGFSEQQTESRCTKAIAQRLSKKLLKDIAIIFNNEWNNGKDFLVSIASLPGKHATRSGNIIGNAYLVTTSEIKGFNSGRLTMNVTYQGKGFELADSITTAFFEAGIRIDLMSMNGNQVEFTWLGVEE